MEGSFVLRFDTLRVQYFVVVVWVVVMVTIDRYLAVCRPLVGAGLRTLQCVRRSVLIVIFAALVYNIPVFLENKVQ